MSYDVVITDRAAEQLKSAAQWWAEHRSLAQAERWYDGFIRAILKLAQEPQRCSLAREHDKFPFEIRQLIYGLGRKGTHRAVFTIRQDKVVILLIRHLAQSDLDFGDLP
jgi:plasmid stabilization system protein ParE